MLGPIGSSVMAIFRLLSPDEIDKYIVREEEEHVIEANLAMAAGAEEFSPHNGSVPNKKKKENKESFPKDSQAEIIPLHKVAEEAFGTSGDEEKNEETPDHTEAKVEKRVYPDQAPSEASLESVGILSASHIKKIEADRLKQENSKKDSATVFLIKERNKLKDSKKRLIKQVAFKSYQTNAAQEFHEEVLDEELLEEGNVNDLKGILLNKKQY